MIPAVSILVPVYNVSNYIERCAHSLFGQTFSDIEYIFVNDCTPDDSIEKLQRVMAQYPERNVKIIHHEKNRGLAAARNTAINNALGKYIQHIDSDDWIEHDMVETMYKKAEAEQADIVVSDIFLEFEYQQQIDKDCVIQNKEDNFRNFILGDTTTNSMCNKLICRRLYDFHNCRTPEGLNYMEDRYITTRLYFWANKIVKIDKAFYHYWKTNDASITANDRKEYHFENVILFWRLFDDFLKTNDVYEKYLPEIELSKVRNKALLFVVTKSNYLRKKYAYLFRDFEMKYLSHLRFGERLVLFFIHYRMYALAQLTRWLILLKNGHIKFF